MTTTVLHVLEALETGVARHVVDVVQHTPGVRHEVAAPRTRVGGGVTDVAALDQLREAGAVVHEVAMRRSPIAPVNGRAVTRLRGLMRNRDIAIAHGHSGVGGALARLAAPSGVRRVYTPNGLMTRRTVVAVERLLGWRTDRLIATSHGEAKLVLDLGLVDAARLAVIPNGIALDVDNPPVLDLRSELGVPAGAPLVGSVGRLVPQKAPMHFVRVAGAVASRRPGVHFVLVGSGPLRDDVDRAVRGHRDLDGRFHVVGHLPGAGAVLDQLDVYVSSSLYEGGPYVPLEAMRAGTPVVLTDVVGNRDTVEGGVSGVVVPAGDVEAMATAVSTLLDDPGLRRRLADAATVRLRERFDVRDMGLALAELYRELSTTAR